VLAKFPQTVKREVAAKVCVSSVRIEHMRGPGKKPCGKIEQVYHCPKVRKARLCLSGRHLWRRLRVCATKWNRCRG